MVTRRQDVAGSAPDSVQVRNVTRQSLGFQVPGRPVHLLPGRTVDLPRAYLETPEVRALLAGGALVLASAAAPGPAEKARSEGAAAPGAKTAPAARAAIEEAAPADKAARREKK